MTYMDEETKTLECMAKLNDGAHCGLTDWYDTLENGIVEALATRKDNWTTGWYASKKEIACARISKQEENLVIEVSVSDDFDTEGLGMVSIPLTTDLEVIRKTIYEAWELAEEDQKENRSVALYVIRNKEGNWIETYLVSVNPYFEDTDSVPGDNYHEFGWQGGGEVPEDIKKQLEEKIDGYSEEIKIGDWKAVLSV
jgi:hypothetical protein